MSKRVIPKGKCSMCDSFAKLPKNPKEIGRICEKCYRLNIQPKIKCSICGKLKIIHKDTFCLKCYKITYEPPKHICFICKNKCISNKKTSSGPVCLKCYDKNFKPKKNCENCKRIKVVKKYINFKPLCGGCASNFIKKQKCVECNNIRKINKITVKGTVCGKCYNKNHKPKHRCTRCKNIKYLASASPNLCFNCYYIKKRKEDYKFYILTNLRNSVRSAFNKYSKTGKIINSSSYGINYKKIIEHLGNCPGESKEYHIDHIIPLSAFDLNDQIHIKAAFSPENHQWLKIEDNLKKSNKYDKNKFDKLIMKYKEGKL